MARSLVTGAVVLSLTAFAIPLAGCSPAGGQALPRANLITGGTGSDWYRIGSAVAERTNAHFPGQPVTAVPGAGGISNPARVGRMPGDFGISFLAFLRSAHRGGPPYRQAFPELRHVATLLQNKLHLIAGTRLEIGSLVDIRDRRLGVRIGTGPPGSAEEFLLREALAALGVSYEDIRSWGGRIDLLGSGERADLFRDGHIDLIVFHAADPSALVTELMISHEGRFLAVPPDVRRTLRERWDVRELVLPAHRYKHLDADVETIGLDFGIFATADVSEHLVHAMVRSIAENVGYLATVHTGFKGWDPKRMMPTGGVPMHAGAERYFRERGWLMP
jgi:TRAP transporter TAXI family solute receptor